MSEELKHIRVAAMEGMNMFTFALVGDNGSGMTVLTGRVGGGSFCNKEQWEQYTSVLKAMADAYNEKVGWKEGCEK